VCSQLKIDEWKANLCKDHQQSKQHSTPNPHARPKLHKRNRKPYTREEQRLHQILLHVNQVSLEGMHERWRLVGLSLALLATRDYERRLWVLARDVCEEGSCEESPEKYGCPSVCGDGDEGTQDEYHEDKVGDVVVSREVIFDVLAKQRREDILCDDRCDNCHCDGGHDGAANQPA
jgi:hypothetical protein